MSFVQAKLARACRPLALTALTLLPAPLCAQEAVTEESYGDIVVTATRREERAQDVPIAVSSLGGEKLDIFNSSGLDIRFLSARTPSLQIESSFGRTFPRFYIRGLGNTDFDPNAAQPVSVVYDDVALENPMLKSFPVFDLASVEVLRGPQGTLFGRNTPAGVVKLDSNRPGSRPNGHASASWGTYNTINVEAAVGGPIGGGFSARMATLLQYRDDWVENDNTTGFADSELEGYRDLAGRFLLAYEDGPFEALFNIHARDLVGTPRVFRAGIFQIGSNRFVPEFDKDHVSLDGLTSQSLTQWGTNLHLSYDVGPGTIHSITAYEEADVESTGDIDGGDCYAFIPGCTLGEINVGAFPVNTGTPARPHEFSQELRFASEDMGGFSFQAGLYYFHQKLDYDEFAYDNGVRNADIRHENKNENFGVYASGEYKATDTLTLRAGLRYSNDDKEDLVFFGPTVPASVTAGSQLVVAPLPVTTEVDGDNISWDVSATFEVTDDINLYARIASGYLGPAIQDRVTFFSTPTTADEQTTISYEAGLKAVSGSVHFDLSAYYWRTEDLQLTAVGGAVNSARLLNADHAVGYGIEADFSARPTDGLAITAGGSYNFTEIRDPDIGVSPCGSGICTVQDPLNPAGLAIIDGNDLPQAPRWVLNATLRYGIPIGDGEAFVFTDWAYRSSINYFLYEAAEFRGRSLLEGGLKLGYVTGGGVELAVFGRNITNQIRSISAIDFNNLTGMINDPRIIGGSVAYKF